MTFRIHNDDCRTVMASMEESSVDAIVTDPPYGLEFMGKAWDKGVPGVEFWESALRVLKPGGHLLSFGGSRTYHRMASAIEDAGFEIRDQIMWVYGSGFPKSHNGPWGGTALKPAHEPIVMARKPLIGTVAANVLAHGTGGLNIDGCRVGYESGGSAASNPLFRKQNGYAITHGADLSSSSFALKAEAGKMNVNALGRWPANLIHDGSDDVLAAFPDALGQQGDLKETGRPRPSSGRFGDMGPPRTHLARDKQAGATSLQVQAGRRRDATSAARFFYCAKTSKADRGDGNTHPTVKPTELMRYLCRLVTPAGGVVLDPFMGSGSTGKAAILEGFKFIGCDTSKEYADIARNRLTWAFVQAFNRI